RESVPMAAVLESLLSEVDARKPITGDRVIQEDIVCVLVADGNSVLAVVFDLIVFKVAVSDPPAKEKTHLPIIVNMAAAYPCVRASWSRVDSITRVAVGFAVEYLNVIRDLKRDAVAVVVSRHAVANDSVLRAIEIDGSPAAAIDVGVFGLVSIHDQIFQDNTIG